MTVMMKVTIIVWILFIATKLFTKGAVNTMTEKEKMTYVLTKEAPAKVWVPCVFQILFIVAGIVCTIVTVILA